jgi:hypothetical protein
MGAEKRRSDRLMLTIPLIVHGTDAKGSSFKEDARTITLNRHGARIQISRPLRSGQTIMLTNLVGRREAEFRVVGPIAPITHQGGEWGVECLDAKENIWGIQFPPASEEEGAESKALLECRRCHAVALMRLSLVEVEVLETSGLLTRPCTGCELATPWGYAEKLVAMAGPLEEAAMVAEAAAEARAAGRGGIEQRKHRRVSLQLPLLVRDYYGGVEITKTENVSKGGFCFVTEKDYHIGEGVLVMCPYNPSAQNIEVRARVVRQTLVEGTTRKVYGVRYDAAPA